MNSTFLLAASLSLAAAPTLGPQNPPEPFECSRTCSADGQVNPVNPEWTAIFTTSDGNGTQACDTCADCQGVLSYWFQPSNPNRPWQLTTDQGTGQQPTTQGGYGITSGSIGLSSGCDDVAPANVIGTQGSQQSADFQAYLYCQC
jgi:hypothetical protein